MNVIFEQNDVIKLLKNENVFFRASRDVEKNISYDDDDILRRVFFREAPAREWIKFFV